MLRRRYGPPVAACQVAEASAWDSDAQALFTAWGASAPDDTRKGLVNDLIVGAKADGWWSLLDWFLVLACHDQADSLVNWKNPAKTATATNTPTFTTDRGWAGDGVSSYLNFGEAVNAAGNQYSLNSACAGGWCNLSGSSSNTKYLFGQAITSVCYYQIRNAGLSGNARINDTTNLNTSVSTGRTGHRAVSRTGSTVKRAFFNGSLSASATTTSNSVGSGNFCGLQSSATYTNERAAALYFGAGMSDTHMSNIHARLNTFLTAIGAN